jgi:predicted dehydrogenase
MKIGLIGCGKQAPKHISGLRKCPGVEIVVADKDPALARALAEKEGVEWVEDAAAIFADPAVVAVDLCTPTPFHAPLIRDAVAAGKDFFCEKPLCETAAEARELRDLADKAGRIGMVGYIYRYAPIFETAREVLAGVRETGTSPVLGKLAVATLRICGRGSAAVWKHRAETGGGAINEMLVHMLDLAVWYFGPITEAELMMKELYRPQRVINGRMEECDAEDFVLLRCMTASGVPVVIQADFLTPSFTQTLDVQGDNGTFMGSIQADMPQFVFTIKESGGYKAGRTNLGVGQVNMFEAQMAAFVEAVKNRVPPDRCTLTDSVDVLEAVERVRTQA